MKIYVCEQYHDNDCGIFTSLESAQRHFDSCHNCEDLVSYETESPEADTGLPVERIQHEGEKLGYIEGPTKK